MRVVIDGCAAPRELSGNEATLVAALATAREQAGERFIVEVLADGIPVPAKDLESPPDFAPYAEEVRFHTVDRDDVIREALESVEAALADLGKQQEEVAALLQTGRSAEALNELSLVLGTWDSVQQLAATLATLESGTPHTQEREDAAVLLGGASQDLLRIMHGVKQAVLGTDWSTLSDILSYDLLDLAAQWQDALNTYRRAYGH
jgi:hypothetical protein